MQRERIEVPMMKRRQIWLVRHGETEWARLGRHTGRTDLPLTALGREQARTVGEILGGRRFDLVLASPLRRAIETCEIAGYAGVALVEPDCMEWDYGDLNGKTRPEVRAWLGADWNIWKGPVPGGETPEDVAERARRVLRGLDAVDGDVAIFAHGHFLRIFTAAYLGLDARAAKHWAMGTGRISVLGRENGYPAIIRWNTHD
jgi:probable phosphoglycerate mutase